MYIQRTHKDADHQAFFVEILMFVNLLNDNDLTVGRCHHQIIRIAIEIAYRTTVEIQCHHPYRAEEGNKAPKRNLSINKRPQQCTTDCQCQHTQGQFIGSFTVDAYFLKFFYSFSHGIVSNVGAKVHNNYELRIKSYEFFWFSQLFDVSLSLKNDKQGYLWKISFIFMYILITQY